jgi:uncharacterized membrane protein
MDQLLAVAYPDQMRAADMLGALRRLQFESPAQLKDAVYVTRALDGDFELHQNVRLSSTDAVDDAFWGLLVGLLFSVSLLGGVVGVAVDAIGDDLAGLGIDEPFVAALNASILPGCSAVFALVRNAQLGTVLAELGPQGGTILQASLARDAMARLHAALRTGRRV